MQKILTHKTVSMTELRDPGRVLSNAGDAPVAVLNRNKVVGYFVPNSVVENVSFESADIDEVKKLMAETLKADQPVLDYLRDK